ncbi:MAG TPA: DNRLRE domain-containing protein [Candidatus Goldiibacteriota bacterium]|nr:DNRLRE domain-containing protein [Candidatus Goldiibacteriota bacterium]
MKKTAIFAFAALAASILLSCTVPGPAGPAGADVYTLEFQQGSFPGAGYDGAADADINNEIPTYSSGGYEAFWVGFDGSKWRGVVKFDISAIVPSNVTVKSAYLTLHINEASVGVTLTAKALTRNWVEGDEDYGNNPDTYVSWNYYNGAGNAWTNPGSDFSANDAITPVFIGASSVNGYISVKLDNSLVQTWITDPVTNYGVVLMDQSEAGGTHYIGVDTKEASDPGLRPKLTVNYSIN